MSLYSDLNEVLTPYANRIKGLKADLEDLDERIDGLGDGVPTEVRQAMLALFNSAAYAETGLTDEIAVIESWAAVVTAISINQSSISISGASTSQLVATTTPTGGTVTWASSDTNVATVSSSGLVTGVGNGTATITASCGGKNATCSVTVSGFVSLTGITASYTQSGTVYNTDTLDSLKSNLVVTASYSDSTTRTLSDSDYTLSGTLGVGTSTITVSYGGKTTTFNVTVTEYVSPVMSATQGNLTTGTTDTDKVTIVLNTLTFNPSEVKTISVDDGYQFFAFTQYGVNDVSNAGTVNSNNKMNVYSIGNNGYVQNGAEANNRIVISNISTWGTSKTYTNSNSSITQEVTGIGIYIKTTDGSALTPEQAVNVFSIS